jgi:serine/threonine-protein kinase SRPK3
VAGKEFEKVCRTLGSGALLINLNRSPSQANSHVVIKITNLSESDGESAKEELKISKHLSKVKSQHPGRRYVRLVEDSFTVKGPYGEHLCLVLEPMRQPISTFARIFGTQNLSPDIFKAFLPFLLGGLDFLHSHCHVIHTGKF